MSGELISNIRAIPKMAFAGQIVNNQLNPLHLAIANTGYRIQSRKLQIPDRFGLFAPGPPRLQVHEGWSFIIMVCWICLTLASNAFSVFLSRRYGLPACQKFGAIFSVTTVPGAVLFWVVAIHDGHRAPGYQWEDWKLRKD